jgi:hypothetical protein
VLQGTAGPARLQLLLDGLSHGTGLGARILPDAELDSL